MWLLITGSSVQWTIVQTLDQISILLTDSDYVDDVVLFANSVAMLADVLTKRSDEAIPLGLSISWTKTKLHSLSDFLPTSTVIVNDNNVETVDNFI